MGEIDQTRLSKILDDENLAQVMDLGQKIMSLDMSYCYVVGPIDMKKEFTLFTIYV